ELAHRLTMAGIAIEGVENVDNDVILDLDLTPNRGDCLGLINLAREVSAITGNELKIPPINIKENDEDISDYVEVEIADTDLCKRYTARVIKNVEIKPSPSWLQEALINSGIRPINNVVDITNYVMLETNQPLHAFDYDLMNKNKKVLVRRAKDGEEIVTLDGTKRVLNNDMLVITDGEAPIALAGVMGGLDSEINDNTVNVLLESAAFAGVNIRKTSRLLGLRSESSMRFEKGVDVNGVIYASNRAAQLIQELAGGEIVKGIADAYPEPVKSAVITLRPERVNYLLGTDISTEQMESYLHSLDFKVTREGSNLLVEVPTYRPDIELEVDLIEEIARLYGYANIPATLPVGNTTQGGLNSYQKFKEKAVSILARNMHEVINYSFISPTMLDNLLLADDSELRNVVKIANPLSEEQSIMRTLLLPGLLDNISRNLARKNENLSFFEMGTVFFPKEEGLPEERLKIAAVVCGTSENNWLKHKITMDFFYLKGILENFLHELGLNNIEFVARKKPGYHPGRNAAILCNGVEIGVIGEVHPLVLENFEIKDKVSAFELELDEMYKLTTRRVMTESITKYPSVERDIAILVSKDITSSQIVKTIRDNGTDILRDVVVFDVYTGEQVPEGYKSMAFKLKLQPTEKTLTENEINDIVQNILAALEKDLAAKLR
ncbi:MAG: phenylalanine--tRNA ligase subunit beta, partial [Syntrophomonadaceae bacterium]|nr:phenylalanine--tRNA ligase subunit beta [Syntrophomonadaceae bacterium]